MDPSKHEVDARLVHPHQFTSISYIVIITIIIIIIIAISISSGIIAISISIMVYVYLKYSLFNFKIVKCLFCGPSKN
jgi:hypothetical protein